MNEKSICSSSSLSFGMQSQSHKCVNVRVTAWIHRTKGEWKEKRVKTISGLIHVLVKMHWLPRKERNGFDGKNQQNENFKREKFPLKLHTNSNWIEPQAIHVIIKYSLRQPWVLFDKLQTLLFPFVLFFNCRLFSIPLSPSFNCCELYSHMNF